MSRAFNFSAGPAALPETVLTRVRDELLEWQGERASVMEVSHRGKAFIDCAPADRTAILDDIAFPKKVKPELAQGAAFFSSFRDLVANGFFTSKIGIDDLQ